MDWVLYKRTNNLKKLGLINRDGVIFNKIYNLPKTKSLHCPIVFAILLFTEYPSDMH